MIFPQFLLLFLCLALPVLALYFWKRADLAVAWVALITVLDIFNSQLYMNLSAALLFGIAVIPHLWHQRETLFRHPGARWITAYAILLGILGAYYGHWSPWADLTLSRSIKDQAGMRSILHLGRTVLEWATAAFLLLELEKSPRKTLSIYLRTLFICSIVLAVSGIAEKWLQVDFYHFFTGGRELLLPDRPRGFAYEPRGLSQNLAYALLTLPFVPFGNWKYFTLPIFLFIGFGFTFSYSGILVLLSGVFLLFALRFGLRGAGLSGSRTRWTLAAFAIPLLLGLTLKSLPETSRNYIHERFQYLSERGFAEKFEVFDAASINFFIHQPQHLPLGTGPGLIYLPASEYIVERDKPIWGNRFDALPHMGAILVIANSGVLGLVLLLYPFFSAFRRKRKTPDALLFVGVVLFGLFFVQIRYYFLFGAAALLCRKTLDPEYHEENSTS
jgi:hypothetical protein